MRELRRERGDSLFESEKMEKKELKKGVNSPGERETMERREQREGGGTLASSGKEG